MQMNEGQLALDVREALVEMYKAGFLDASKPKNKKDHDEMNKKYRIAFLKRFENSVTKILKDEQKKQSKGRKKEEIKN